MRFSWPTILFAALVALLFACSSCSRVGYGPPSDHSETDAELDGGLDADTDSGADAEADDGGDADAPKPIATLSNTPANPSNDTALNVTVAGADVADYQYKLIPQPGVCTGGGYNGTWISVGTPITEPIGGDGNYKLCVLGRDLAHNEQPEDSATEYRWTKDTRYRYNRSIVINHLQVGLNRIGTLPATGFPVLVSLSGAWLKTTTVDPVNGRIESSNGYDIFFRQADGITDLVHEIEKYDGTNGTLVAWVRLDSLSKAVDTTFYVFYGNGSIAAPTEDPISVWDASYMGVWHLGENAPDETAGTIHYDSTVNSNNGIQSGNATSPGKIGNAQDFDGRGSDGVYDYIDLGNHPTLSPSLLTVSAWAKREGLGDGALWQDIVGNIDYSGSSGGYLLYLSDETALVGLRVLGDSSGYDLDIPVDTSQWHLYTGTFDGATEMIYVDGVFKSSQAASLGISTFKLHIGEHGSYVFGGWPFDGLIDEVRISNIARSPDWIATCYNNQSDTSIGAGKFILSLGPETH